MASVPLEPRPVLGRLDISGRLIVADPELEMLQRDAGAEVGQLLALPQVAAVAELARKLGTAVARPAVAASADNDIELWVNARPEGDEIALSLEGWTTRPPAGPRLASILGGGEAAATASAQNEWAADEELRIISLSSDLAELLGVEVSEAAGSPLTRIVRLEEDSNGEMPLISALAARRGFAGQRARSRSNDGSLVLLSGEVVTGADGSFAGFRGTAESEKE
jgi:PAS domain-containing protein